MDSMRTLRSASIRSTAPSRRSWISAETVLPSSRRKRYSSVRRGMSSASATPEAEMLEVTFSAMNASARFTTALRALRSRVDSRTDTQTTPYFVAAPSPPPSMRRSSRSTASSPQRCQSGKMLDIVGYEFSQMKASSSQPSTATSSGTLRPAAAQASTTSFATASKAAKTAHGRGRASRNRRSAAEPRLAPGLGRKTGTAAPRLRMAATKDVSRCASQKGRPETPTYAKEETPREAK